MSVLLGRQEVQNCRFKKQKQKQKIVVPACLYNGEFLAAVLAKEVGCCVTPWQKLVEQTTHLLGLLFLPVRSTSEKNVPVCVEVTGPVTAG